MAVGAGCSAFPESTLKFASISFSDAVTAIWTWYHEELRHDLDFLIPRGDYQQRSTLKGFESLLDDQRHMNQHANFNRSSEAQAWRAAIGSNGVEPSDAALVDALLKELDTALNTAAAIARKASRDTAAVSAWRTHNARTPESEMRAVLADIGRINLQQRRVDTIVRRFEGHPKLRYAKTAQDRARIAAVVAMEMNLDALTLPYDEILDEFGLIGDPLGFSLLLVAHGVEAAGNTSDRLIPVLRDAWQRINPNTT
jgi:hypothetical protein